MGTNQWAGLQQLRSCRRTMRNNFTAAFPFHKKEVDAATRSPPAFLNRQTHPVAEAGEKRMGGESAEREGGTSGKQIQTTEEESIASDQVSSCTSSEITTKPSKVEVRADHRAASPSPRPTLSPRAPPPPYHVRATLRNLLQARASPTSKHEQYLSPGGHGGREMKLTASIRSNRTFAQALHSPIKSLEKENLILREENELLRRELSEIKRNLLSGGCKKDDVITNLRNTLRKEDGEIKELRVKLQLANKKGAALATLIENKDEEIAFLSGKLGELQLQLLQVRERNGERIEKLKERINFTLMSYGEVEGKWSRAEMDWLNFKEKWMEEKGIYLHRIAFLEDYIANN